MKITHPGSHSAKQMSHRGNDGKKDEDHWEGVRRVVNFFLVVEIVVGDVVLEPGCWRDRRASLLERTKVTTLTVWYRSEVGIPLTIWVWNEWELPLQWFGVRSGEWQWTGRLGQNEKNEKVEAKGETWRKAAAPLSLMSFTGSHLGSGTLGENFGASISFFFQTLYC